MADSRTVRRIFFLLFRTLGEHGVWLGHTGYRIAQGWIEPDVSASWPDRRFDGKYFVRFADDRGGNSFASGKEIDRKLTLYFADGAQEVWVIDTKHNAVTVYSRKGNQVIGQAVDRELRSEAAGAVFPLAEIFG